MTIHVTTLKGFKSVTMVSMTLEEFNKLKNCLNCKKNELSDDGGCFDVHCHNNSEWEPEV